MKTVALFLNFSGSIGRSCLRPFSNVVNTLCLLSFSLTGLLKWKLKGRDYLYRETVSQIYFTGVKAALFTGIIGLAMGVSIIFVFYNELPKQSLISYINAILGRDFKNLLGGLLVTIIIRTLGPLVTAIIITARSGAAIATHIGNMAVNHEIEAMESMGIDVPAFLSAPRIIGMIVSLSMINIFFDSMAIGGGVLVAKQLQPDLTYEFFFNNFFASLKYMHLLEILLKSLFFGAGVAIICTRGGLKVEGGVTMVPVAASKAIVNSLLYVFFINAAITVLFTI